MHTAYGELGNFLLSARNGRKEISPDVVVDIGSVFFTESVSKKKCVSRLTNFSVLVFFLDDRN